MRFLGPLTVPRCWSEDKGRAWLRHAAAEMGNLQNLLPELHEREAGPGPADACPATSRRVAPITSDYIRQAEAESALPRYRLRAIRLRDRTTLAGCGGMTIGTASRLATRREEGKGDVRARCPSCTTPR